MTNRKSHARFRLVLKSVILNDLEGSLCTLFQNTCVFRSPPQNLNEDRPILSAAKMTLDSGNIRFMRIFAGVPWRGSVKRQCGVIENADFRAFERYGSAP